MSIKLKLNIRTFLAIALASTMVFMPIGRVMADPECDAAQAELSQYQEQLQADQAQLSADQAQLAADAAGLQTDENNLQACQEGGGDCSFLQARQQ